MVVIDPGTPERLGRDGIWCDPCIEPLIRALNAAGLRTRASCCGHGQCPTWVILDDDRHIVIVDRETGRRVINEVATDWERAR